MRDKAPTLPHDVEHVVMTALDKDYTKRFGSMLAFAKALEQAAQPQDVQPGVKPPTRTIEPTVEAKPIMPPKAPTPQEKPPVTPPPSLVKPAVQAKPVGTIVCTYRGHSQRVNAVAWSPDGNSIASGSDDKTAQVWEITKSSVICTYRGHTSRVNTVMWSPDKLYVASGSDDKSVQVWNAATGKNIYDYIGSSGWCSVWVCAVAWSPDGTRVAAGSDDKAVRVWNALLQAATC